MENDGVNKGGASVCVMVYMAGIYGRLVCVLSYHKGNRMCNGFFPHHHAEC